MCHNLTTDPLDSRFWVCYGGYVGIGIWPMETTNFSIRYKKKKLAEMKKICKEVNNATLTAVMRTYMEFHMRFPNSYDKFLNRLNNCTAPCTAPVNTTDMVKFGSHTITPEEQLIIEAYKKLKSENPIAEVNIYDLSSGEYKPVSLSQDYAEQCVKNLITKGKFMKTGPCTIELAK